MKKPKLKDKIKQIKTDLISNGHLDLVLTGMEVTETDIAFAFAEDQQFKIMLSSMINEREESDKQIIKVLCKGEVGYKIVRQMYRESGSVPALKKRMVKDKSLFSTFGLEDQARQQFIEIRTLERSGKSYQEILNKLL